MMLPSARPTWKLHSQNVSIHNLSLSGELMIPSGFSFTVASAITNDGTIRINDNSTSTANLRTNGQIQLLGTGRVVFANPADDDNYITYTSSSDRLTIGADQTITNEIAGTTGHIVVQITNGGLIDADGGTIWLESYPKINNNLIRARNAGVLQINGMAVDNSLGIITVESNSFVKSAGNASITGGAINGEGMVRVTGTTTFGNLHIDGPTVEIETGDTLKLVGTIVNNGTINIKDIEWDGYAYLKAQGEVNLNGAGKVLFISPPAGPDSYIGYNSASDRLIVGPNQTIATAGPGTLGHVTVQLTNNGLVEANGGTLSLENYVKINNTLLRARNGGVLKISGCSVDNAAGTITAESNGFVEPGNSAVITGGTIDGTGIVRLAGTATFSSLRLVNTSVVEIETDDTLKLVGTIVNDGTIKINDTMWSGYAYLKSQGDVYLNGSGKVLFIATGGPDSYIAYNTASDRLIVGSNQTIATAGPGTLGHVTVQIINNGLVEAYGGTLQLENQTMTNQNILRPKWRDFQNLNQAGKL